jgi:hypothetical protein
MENLIQQEIEYNEEFFNNRDIKEYLKYNDVNKVDKKMLQY